MVMCKLSDEWNMMFDVFDHRSQSWVTSGHTSSLCSTSLITCILVIADVKNLRRINDNY